MLRALKDIFDNLVSTEPTPEERQQALQLATAVLLVEVMRADSSKASRERQPVAAALRQRFALDDAALALLLARAEQAAENAYDYHHFTASINDSCSQEQKIQIVEAMWQVAYADAQVDAYEHHAISKIAGLLHVTHGEYIGAKMRAKEAAGLIS